MIKRKALNAFWDAPYRPLFLSAFLYALLSVAWWPLGVQLGLPEPGLKPAVLWHVHELLFGFAAAAIAGYLLTALPGWTGRQPLRGPALKALVSVWLLARTASAMDLPPAAALFLNSAFFLALCGYIFSELAAARIYCKLGYAGAVLALGLGEAFFLVNAKAGNIWTCLNLAQSVLIGFLVLMFFIGARAIPAFTRNWLALSGRSTLQVQEYPKTRAVSQVLLILALALKLAGAANAANVLLVAAAMAMFCSIPGWRTLAVLSNPLLAALHVAFLWLPAGALLVGVTGLDLAGYPVSTAIHAITIGGMSGLVMAIAGRAGAHSSGGTMRASKSFSIGVLLNGAAAWIRLSVPLFPALTDKLTVGAALLWCTGWLVFIAGFLPALSGPPRRPVLSGRRLIAQDPTEPSAQAPE